MEGRALLFLQAFCFAHRMLSILRQSRQRETTVRARHGPSRRHLPFQSLKKRSSRCHSNSCNRLLFYTGRF